MCFAVLSASLVTLLDGLVVLLVSHATLREKPLCSLEQLILLLA